MAHLLLTPGESLLMRAALKSRLTELGRSLSRAASWQRSLLPQAREQGVLASLCRKVEGVAEHPSLPQRMARHVTHLLHRDLA